MLRACGTVLAYKPIRALQGRGPELDASAGSSFLPLSWFCSSLGDEILGLIQGMRNIIDNSSFYLFRLSVETNLKHPAEGYRLIGTRPGFLQMRICSVQCAIVPCAPSVLCVIQAGMRMPRLLFSSLRKFVTLFSRVTKAFAQPRLFVLGTHQPYPAECVLFKAAIYDSYCTRTIHREFFHQQSLMASI